MEYWKSGRLEDWNNGPTQERDIGRMEWRKKRIMVQIDPVVFLFSPFFHHSNVPLFHFSAR